MNTSMMGGDELGSIVESKLRLDGVLRYQKKVLRFKV